MKNKYIEAIKANIRRCSYKMQVAIETPLGEVSYAKHFGAVPTWHLKMSLNEPCAVIRKELRKLEKQGLVIGFSREGNRIDWFPVWYLAEIKEANG